MLIIKIILPLFLSLIIITMTGRIQIQIQIQIQTPKDEIVDKISEAVAFILYNWSLSINQI